MIIIGAILRAFAEPTTAPIGIVDPEENFTYVNPAFTNMPGYSKDELLYMNLSHLTNREEIDLVILDIIMPEANASDIFSEMREINLDVKVLISSGYSIDGEAQRIIDKGALGFIQKPFSIEELSQKIEEIISTP